MVMGSLRVLLVDDEEELVSTVAERLELRGIDAEALTSGAAALERLAEQKFDVVVVDVKMPGMDGLELLKRIKTMQPETQVILLTGRGSGKESQRGLEEGAFDYLIKPINLDDLIIKMRLATGGRP
jgi:DNA-binding response OmpR family regulator